VKIQFAHRTFPWVSEARGKAHVHVVIVGFAAFDQPTKLIYDYEGETPTVVTAKNISPYLVEGSDVALTNCSYPISHVPDIGIGNKPIDGGNYLFKPDEKTEFLKLEPGAKKYFKRWIGSEEFINGVERWCLWLGDCPPDKLRNMPQAMARVEAVKKFRLASKSAPTKKLADKPTRFHVENFPKSHFLLIPKVSSERRKYIPMGFMSPEILVSDLVFVVRDATLYHFGVLSSVMHMAWMRLVAGRLESRYRYSAGLVYNNYPWPESATDKQRVLVEAKAQAVLDARAAYLDVPGARVVPTRSTPATKASLKSPIATPLPRAVDWDNPRPACTLADLYDPLSMPPELVQAHAELDRAVEKCYRPEPFHSDRERVEYLFALYEKLTAPLLPVTPKTRGRRSQTTATTRKQRTPGLPAQPPSP
jgi:hypothetical protein